MYLAIRDGSIKECGYTSLKEGLMDLGLTAVEVEYHRGDKAVGMLGEMLDLSKSEGRESLKAQLKENKINICAFLMHNNFRNKDLEDELGWAVRCVECAAEIGITAIRIDAIMAGEKDLSTEEAKAQAVKCLKEIVNRTSGTDVVLGMENHGFQGNNPEFLDGIIIGVNSPRVGVTMDTGNFYWSGKPLDEVYKILEHFAPYTMHTHVKNIKYPFELRNKQRELGWEYGKYVSPIYEGDIDHKKVVGFLKKAGYKGDFTIEDESLGKFSKEEKIKVVKEDIKHLGSML